MTREVRRTMRLLLAIAGASTVLLVGCASRPTSAPVADRAAVPAPVPKPPVREVAAVPGAPASTEPAGYYRVKRGDTLYSIALDHGVDNRDVARWNSLDDPGKIRTGQVLRVTPPENESPVQVGAARGAGFVTSRPLKSRPLESSATTAPAEGASATETTKTGPKALRLPYSSENLALLQKADSAQSASAAQAADAKPGSVAATAAQPATKAAASSTTQPASPQPAPREAAEARDPSGLEFVWPARGKILHGFAEPARKGVDIGGNPGDPVVAAAPGRVIYIGSGIRGYGKLIVIKHDNNFNSVYAHNREILVKQDQSVTRGQKIAELGATDSETPMLHFEIRKSGKPVDPVKYLPPAPPL